MNTRILKPHPALRPYISYYMYFETGVKGKWVRAGTSPTALPLLSIALETDKFIYKHRGSREPLIFSSQFTKYTPMTVYGKTKIFNIFFHPTGSFQLLGISQKGLNNRVINLSDFVGSSASNLKERLAEQITLADAHKVIESFILRKLSLQKKYNSAKQLAYVVDRIALHSNQSDIIKVIWLCADYSISRLKRQMQKIVGTSPQMYQRISRFNNVLKYIRSMKPP
jgi:hypothetical protein